MRSRFFCLVFVISLFLALSLVSSEKVGIGDSGRIVFDKEGGNVRGSGEGPSGPLPYCGDEIRHLPFEQCDGPDLAGETCASLLGDKYAGDLGCKRDCVWDTSGCYLKEEEKKGNNNGGSNSGSSSGSGGVPTGTVSRAGDECIENWVCSDWSAECEDGKQTRTCEDSNNCGTEDLKPILEKICQDVTEEDLMVDSEGLALLSLITGASIGIYDGVRTEGAWLIYGLLVVVLMTLAYHKGYLD